MSKEIARDIQEKRRIRHCPLVFTGHPGVELGQTEVRADQAKRMAFMLILTQPVHRADVTNQSRSFFFPNL